MADHRGWAGRQSYLPLHRLPSNSVCLESPFPSQEGRPAGPISILMAHVRTPTLDTTRDRGDHADPSLRARPTHSSDAPSCLDRNLEALSNRGAIDRDTHDRLASIEPAPSNAPAPSATDRLNNLDAAPEAVSPPLIIVGLDAPQIAASLPRLRQTESSAIFRRRIIIIHEHEASLAASLAATDLTHAIADEATEWFVALGSLDRFRNWLIDRIDDALPKETLALSDDQRTLRLRDRTARVLADCTSRQQANASTLISAARATADSQPHLARRAAFEQGASRAKPLRVLICGSVYTTYIKHSAEDLADAFRSLGHDARVLTERDTSTRLTAVNYARAITEHRPDLIIVANYTRTMLGNAFPDGIPFVSWIQDAMPQFFDQSIGRAQSESDMIAGNTMPELFTRYHYPQHAAMPFCVPASAQKFQTVPVSPALARRHECEIAFVSHHSETPDQMRDRLARESQAGGNAQALLDRLFEDAHTLVSRAATQPILDAASEMCSSAFRDTCAAEPTTQQHSVLLHSVLLPLAGRIFRHEALAWAADIAESRAWRLHLYGNGWERCQRFARYARGPIEHGEDLRASYQAARVHLHLDINTLTHQRMSECALSGGLPIARFIRTGLDALRNAALDELLDTATPIDTAPDGARTLSCSDAPLGRLYQSQLDALNITGSGTLTAPPGLAPMGRFYRERIAPQFDAARVFGDLSTMTFSGPDALERILARAVDDAEWRAARSAEMRQGISRYTTTEVFAQRLIEHAAVVVGWREAREQRGNPWPPSPEDAARYRAHIEERLDA